MDSKIDLERALKDLDQSVTEFFKAVTERQIKIADRDRDKESEPSSHKLYLVGNKDGETE